MLKESFKLSFKVILLVITYYILESLFEDVVIIIIVIGIALAFVAYNLIVKGNSEYKLEVLCDADKYLESVLKKHSNKEESIFNIYLAYAYLYQGDYDNAKTAMQKVIKNSIENKSKLILIYYMVSLKLAFEDGDLDKFNSLFNEFKSIDLENHEKINYKTFEIPKYILEQKYEEVIELLIDLIPKQTKRYLIIEMEYYLAVAYLNLDRLEDARAVLEFMSNKNFRIIYIQKCKELFKELEKNN